MLHLTCGINSLLHSVNLILFTLLLVHLILYTSLRLPMCFTNPFLHSLSDSFQTAFMDPERVLD